MSRRPISVVKSVLHRNCSDIRPTNPNEDDNWCEWAPFGKIIIIIMLMSLYANLDLFKE